MRVDITDHDIQAFIEAWKKDFGETLTADQARPEASRLLTFFQAIGEVSNHEEKKEG